MKRSKFQLSNNKIKSCLELVHTKVVGRLKTSHIGYNKFFVTFQMIIRENVECIQLNSNRKSSQNFIEFYEPMKNKYNS